MIANISYVLIVTNLLLHELYEEFCWDSLLQSNVAVIVHYNDRPNRKMLRNLVLTNHHLCDVIRDLSLIMRSKIIYSADNIIELINVTIRKTVDDRPLKAVAVWHGDSFDLNPTLN